MNRFILFIVGPARGETKPTYRYEAFTNKLTWKQARKLCQKKGGDLANHGIETEALRK